MEWSKLPRIDEVLFGVIFFYNYSNKNNKPFKYKHFMSLLFQLIFILYDSNKVSIWSVAELSCMDIAENYVADNEMA